MDINFLNPSHINALQNHRCHLWQQQPTDVKDECDIHGLLEREHLLRKNTQKELFYRNKIAYWEARAENTGKNCSSKIEKYKRVLNSLDRHYRILVEEWYESMETFAKSPLADGINLWRSHSNWYMHKTLREDCVERGGCCGRSCGCCWHRETLLPHREHAAGHCTVNCECCDRNRGSPLSEDAKERLERRYDLTEDTEYFARIRDASLLGILEGSAENPFDMIEESLKHGTNVDTFV